MSGSRYEEFKKIIKKFKAIQCAEIQDGRHSDMENLCVLITFKTAYIKDS